MYYRSAGDAQLASIGLLSFAAIAQLAPAFFGGLFWRRATAARRHRRHDRRHPGLGLYAAAADLCRHRRHRPAHPDRRPVGHRVCCGRSICSGSTCSPLVHGVVWSLVLNILAYIGFSLRREPSAIERLQANTFVPSDLTPIAPSFRLWRSSVTVEELTTTVARYLGEERTRTAFETFAASPPHQPRTERRSRFPPGASCRAYSGLGDRRRVLAAGAVAAAAQAHGLDQGRA